jgi:hypothetical protein
MYVVKSIIAHLVGRLRQLALRAPAGKEADALIGMTALVSSLTANFLRTGHFEVPREVTEIRQEAGVGAGGR